MKQRSYLLLLCLLTLLLPSCAVVGGIFKAGMIWGIFLVMLVIGLIIYLISRAGKK